MLLLTKQASLTRLLKRLQANRIPVASLTFRKVMLNRLLLKSTKSVQKAAIPGLLTIPTKADRVQALKDMHLNISHAIRHYGINTDKLGRSFLARHFTPYWQLQLVANPKSIPNTTKRNILRYINRLLKINHSLDQLTRLDAAIRILKSLPGGQQYLIKGKYIPRYFHDNYIEGILKLVNNPLTITKDIGKAVKLTDNPNHWLWGAKNTLRLKAGYAKGFPTYLTDKLKFADDYLKGDFTDSAGVILRLLYRFDRAKLKYKGKQPIAGTHWGGYGLEPSVRALNKKHILQGHTPPPKYLRDYPQSWDTHYLTLIDNTSGPLGSIITGTYRLGKDGYVPVKQVTAKQPLRDAYRYAYRYDYDDPKVPLIDWFRHPGDY